jgi:hypothetical protein
VRSVPSDSPDDWRALQDLREKAELRKKYGLELETHIEKFQVNLQPSLCGYSTDPCRRTLHVRLWVGRRGMLALVFDWQVSCRQQGVDSSVTAMVCITR